MSLIFSGKTTVAKIYGAILKELGFLSNGSVETFGASKLVGDVVGSTASKVNSLFDTCTGKVILIDEAYVLAQSIYGKEALDTIVERVQGTPGEDFVVLLLGYEDKMLQMLRECNPGLARRFKAEASFHFQDYDDAALTEILSTMAKERGLELSQETAKASVANVLAKQRAKPNFGNAGACKNLLDNAVERMSARRRKDRGGDVDSFIVEDFFEHLIQGGALKALDSLVNVEHIKSQITRIEKSIEARKARGSCDPKELLDNWTFTGLYLPSFIVLIDSPLNNHTHTRTNYRSTWCRENDGRPSFWRSLREIRSAY